MLANRGEMPRLTLRNSSRLRPVTGLVHSGCFRRVVAFASAPKPNCYGLFTLDFENHQWNQAIYESAYYLGIH